MACASGKGVCALHMPAQRQRSRPRYASARAQSSKLCAHERYAQMVELADTLDSGSSAKAWGFKSPSGHNKRLPRGSLYCFGSSGIPAGQVMMSAKRENYLIRGS